MPKKSARRARRQREKKAGETRTKLKRVLFFLLAVFGVWLFIFATTKYWDGKTKLPVAFYSEDSVSLVVFDPVLEKTTAVLIPGNTEVQVARELGTWKLGSVAKLGENENLEGRLLTETLVNYFGFPVYVWGETSFGESGLPNNFAQLLLTKNSNLGTGDKLKLTLFSLGVRDFKKESINLASTRYLQEKDLVSGEKGFVLESEISGALGALFAEPSVAGGVAGVQIINATGTNYNEEPINMVVGMLGARIASITKVSTEDFDCRVSGTNTTLVDKLSKVFSCEINDGEETDSFAAKIFLGEKFARRF